MDMRRHKGVLRSQASADPLQLDALGFENAINLQQVCDSFTMCWAESLIDCAPAVAFDEFLDGEFTSREWQVSSGDLTSKRTRTHFGGVWAVLPLRPQERSSSRSR